MLSLEETRNSFLHKKIKLETRVFGNKTCEWAISMTNLSPIEKGTIGIIIDIDQDPDTAAVFVTVRFPGAIFVNISFSVFSIL